MKNDEEMHRVLRVVRSARAHAIDSVKQNFPDLYATSARVFETMPAGSLSHHERLGEYLTEWSNSPGRSPLESLVSGDPSEVLDDLAGCTGDTAGPIGDVEFSQAEQTEPLPDEDSRAYMAFCHHYGTEEGMSVCIAVASSAAAATRTFLEQAPGYSHRDMQVTHISNDGEPDADPIQSWVSQRVLGLIASNPPGTTTSYLSLHYSVAS